MSEREDAPALGHVAHAGGGEPVGGRPGEVASVDDDRAPPGRQQPGRDAQQRGLAGAVGADERDDRAVGDGDADVAQHDACRRSRR